MSKIIVSSALPYVNNIPHLGNLVQVLSGDAYSRFVKMKGYNAIYICGTDEYGTATETKALKEKVSPRELCNKFFKLHKEIYDWFDIEFDFFGRTTSETHKEMVRELFNAVYENGFIFERESEQLYCPQCLRFLADRLVEGICPHCLNRATGDQCENCSSLLSANELLNPQCSVCKSTPILKKTKHLYLDLAKLEEDLKEFFEKSNSSGNWNNNAIQVTKSWLKKGLKERAITRDLKWGISVPLEKWKDKVFYVWFDAPIAYISFTRELLKENWQDWWLNQGDVKLVQFIGKDNIPFHTILFPATLIASRENWTMLNTLSSSEYLNYENQKFSKSAGRGIFGDNIQESGIESDIWRFYIYYNRPEKADFNFFWEDFLDKVNSELIGNFSNLVNRVLTFYKKFFKDKLEQIELKEDFWKEIKIKYKQIEKHFENAELKAALKIALEISNIANKTFQESEPWREVKSNPLKVQNLILNLVYLIKDLSIIMYPFIPNTAKKIRSFFKESYEFNWNLLAKNINLKEIENVEIIFKKLESEQIEKLKIKYSGGSEKMEREIESEKDIFKNKIDLRVAKILSVELHPNAEKLYILKVADGNSAERQIVSGLVEHYKREELIGKHIVLVNNLKPSKLRGELSEGMLLAAAKENDENYCQVIFIENIEENPIPGTKIVLESEAAEEKTYGKISINTFFSVKITVKDNFIKVEDENLISLASKKALKVYDLKEGLVG